MTARATSADLLVISQAYDFTLDSNDNDNSGKKKNQQKKQERNLQRTAYAKKVLKFNTKNTRQETRRS